MTLTYEDIKAIAEQAVDPEGNPIPLDEAAEAELKRLFEEAQKLEAGRSGRPFERAGSP